MSKESQTIKQQYPVVDVVKYICALLVVSIHVAPLTSFFDEIQIARYLNYGIKNCVARVAVPFFFASAGFFLFRKIDTDHFDINVPKNYVFKLLQLLGVWTVLLFAGAKGHLWYMSELIIAVCILSLLLNKSVSLQKIALLAAFLYLIGLLGEPYFALLKPLRSIKFIDYTIEAYYSIFKTTRNGLFMGFPFLCLGGIIEKKNVSMKPFHAFLGFLVSMIALLCEAFLVRILELPKDVNMYIFVVPVVFFLLVFSVNVSVKPSRMYYSLRNVGIIVYFGHLFVYRGILLVWEVVERLSGVDLDNSLLNYLLTITLATGLGIVIDALSKKEKFSYLKYLYS